MNLLLANDDGIDAPGLKALAEPLGTLGTVWTVAPETEQSARSHAFTLHKPLRATPRGERRWAVSGTPVDCVYLGVHALMPTRPDLVVSGINKGGNIGNDVFYSGTFAAALEAALEGIPALAVSLDVRPGQPVEHWDTAVLFAMRVLKKLTENPLPHGVFLNLNVPNRPPQDVAGLRVTTLGKHRYETAIEVKTDPRGQKYYWIGGSQQDYGTGEHTDGVAIEDGYATLTPMYPDLTRADMVASIGEWFRA